MAKTGKLSIRVVFADDTKNTFNIDNINPSVGVNPNLTQIIEEFNANNGGELSSKMKSKNGANWIKIDSAYYTETEREYIF